jgi:hypothetical protein
MKKLIILFIGAVLLTGAGIAYYLYNKPCRNVEEEGPAVRISAIQLFNDYSENEKKGDSLYLNKVVEINGQVSEIEKDQKGETVLILKEDDDIFGVACSIDESDPENKKKSEMLKTGDTVILKGICTGFADEVKLNKCVFVNQ